MWYEYFGLLPMYDLSAKAMTALPEEDRGNAIKILHRHMKMSDEIYIFTVWFLDILII